MTSYCRSLLPVSAVTPAGSIWPAGIGGEEFVVIMPDTELDRAYHVGERLRECIEEEPFPVNSTQELRVTASVGIATIDADCRTGEQLLKRADEALYRAKREGRNRVVCAAA